MIGSLVPKLARRELAQFPIDQRDQALHPLLVPVDDSVEESGDFRRLGVHNFQDTAFPPGPPLSLTRPRGRARSQTGLAHQTGS